MTSILSTIRDCYCFRSDIQYSIDDDTESLNKELDPELATTRTPIFNPKKNGDLKGSENSLLTDEDMWLRKGKS